MLKHFLPLSQNETMKSFYPVLKLVPDCAGNFSVGMKLPYLGISKGLLPAAWE